VRIALACDLSAAFRLLNSSSFSPAWLTHVGSQGETPLMAASRRGCGQVVALIMLHPQFDMSTMRRVRQRKDLATYAKENGYPGGKQVEWSGIVVEGIHTGRVAREDVRMNARLSLTDRAWFLPEPGEWVAPATMEDMGLPDAFPPRLPEAYLLGMANPGGFVVTHDGARARIGDLVPLWYLMVRYLQAAPASPERESAWRYLRSIGWTLFFSYGRGSLASNSRAVHELAQVDLDIPPDEDPVHDAMRARGANIVAEYRNMGVTLAQIWDRTGDWYISK